MTWFVPIEKLTQDQLTAVQMDTRIHRVIFGPPGSGKTIVLLHRARYLCDKARVDAARFRNFVYTRVLREYIRSALEFLRLPENCALTFDQWCVGYYRQYFGYDLPQHRSDPGPDFSAVRVAVLNHLRRNGFRNAFEFVLVDEAQDLDQTAFEILKQISRHVTVCADDKQQLYDSGASQAEIVRELGLHQENLTLLGAYRCVPYVAQLAAELLDDSREKKQFINQVQTDTARQETPLLFHALDYADEKRQVAEVLAARAGLGERIALLLPSRNLLFDLVNYIEAHGLQIEIAGNTARGMQLPSNFSNSIPKAMTYWSAKGLTFDTVLLPRLITHAFPHRMTGARLKRLLFVGITRATNWVYMGTEMGHELALLSTFLPREELGALTIRTGSSPSTASKAPSAPCKGDDLTAIL